MTSANLDPALAALCAEAEAARAAGDLPAAAFAYAIAVGMLPPAGADEIAYELRLARATCLHGAGDFAAEAEELAQLEALVARHPDQARRVTLALRRAALLIVCGDAAAAQLLAATALAEAHIAGGALEAESLFILAEAAYYLNDFATARARAERAIAAYMALGDMRGEAYARRVLGLAMLSTGGDGMPQLQTSLELSRAIGDRAGEALSLNAIGIGTADRAQARSVYMQGLAIAETSGDRESEAVLANNLGTVYLALGLYGQARSYAGRAVRLARALDAHDMLAAFLETLGRAFGGLGQHDRARAALREAFTLAESIGNRGTAALSLICLARSALDEGRHAEAARDLERAAALSASIGARADEAAALAWRAAAHLLAGEPADARAASARAVALLQPGRAGGEFPPQEVWWQRYRALTALSPGAPAPPAEAVEALRQARDMMYAAIASLSDPGLRRSYLGRVQVNRAILDALATHEDPAALAPPVPPPVSHGGLQDQMTRLLGIAARLNDLRDAAALREMLLDELVELCGAERLLLLVGPSLEMPEALIARGVSPALVEPLRAAVMPALREALRRRRALTFDGPDDPDDHAPLALRPRSAFAIPLISGARTVGAFYADVRAFFGPFTASDLQQNNQHTIQGATPLENAPLYPQTLKAKEELERQVAERTADLRAANLALTERAAEAQAARAAAEAAYAAKTVFLANISHELRTPLNAVIGFAQVLQRDQGFSERQRELLGIIGRSGDHLLGLINDVLELSKIEAGRLGISPAPFDLHAALADLEGLFRLRAETRQLEFAVTIAPDVPRYVLGDEGRLRQVLINLVGNALKFTHAGRVAVEAEAEPDGAHQRLRIAVSDTGDGMGPDELESLFRPFMQTESGRRSQEGTGLGLALSRQLARLMDGDITVSSRPGVGSRFVVELLVDQAPPPSEPRRTSQIVGLVTAGRRYRVLVADERWQARRLLAEWLAEAGVEAREATDGAQALATWAAWRPHIALLDADLPIVDGLEAARRIRESPGGRATVVVAMAAHQPDGWADPLCDDLLSQPVGRDALLTCVARHLGIDLRYADDAQPADLEPLTRSHLEELPARLRAELAAAAATSDPAAVAAALARVSAGWPELGRRLGALADEFQFETIELLTAEGDQC
ncbi:MAG TPA: ATP-binding protein [Chloroflexaceae bacterium]|nr:ATP-binding protein [Chloroflexaceae bacterium]